MHNGDIPGGDRGMDTTVDLDMDMVMGKEEVSGEERWKEPLLEELLVQWQESRFDNARKTSASCISTS